jgi:YVTN family beta-propeller protein
MDFRILGPLEVVENERSLPLGRGKQRALLGLLLLHANEVVGQDRLIDELWGESPPPTAVTALHGYVSRLRKLLGDERLETTPPGYRLRVGANELDRDRFEALAAERRHAEALALWRGPPLDDLAYEPFVQEEIARLEELRLVCIEGRIGAELDAGRAAEVVGELERLVRQHPLRERFRAQLMLALYRSGRQAEALEAFQAARATLVEELGIEPGDELKLLQKQILAQDRALSATPPAEPVAQPPRRPRRARRYRWAIAALAAAVATTAATAMSLGHDGKKAPAIVTNSVVRIDPATNEITTVVPVGQAPFGLAKTERYLWVADRHDNTLTRIDTRTRATRTFGGFPAPRTLAVDGTRIWVGSDSSAQVVAIDGLTGIVANRVRLREPTGYLAVGAGSLWVSHGRPFSQETVTVSRVGLRTQAITPIRLGIGAGAASVVFTRGAAWVPLTHTGELVRIDFADESRVRVAVGGLPAGAAAGFGAVWVASYYGDAVRRVNTVTGQVENVVHVGIQPLEVATGAGSVWVTNHRACTISRIDPRTGKIVATITTRLFPTDVLVTADGVWVSVAATKLEGVPGRGPGCASAAYGT